MKPDPMYHCPRCGLNWPRRAPRRWWTRDRVAIALAGTCLTAAAFCWAKILGWL